MGFYTDMQKALPDFGTPRVAPRLRVGVKLVGIAVPNNSVVQDDIDGAYGFVILTPALVREAVAVSPAASDPEGYTLQLDRGGLDVPAVEQEILRLVPPGATVEFHVIARVVAEVELALKPESVALGGFGAIAALVCLVLGAQAISRQLRWGDDDRRAMRALGAGPAVTTIDGLIGVLGAVALGSLVAIGLAVGLSPLSPLGPVRPVYPDSGTAFDWTVFDIGLAVLLGVLGVGAVALSYLGTPHRAASGVPATARGSGIPAEPSRRGCPWPVWSVSVLPSNRREAAPPCRCALRWWAPSSPLRWC